MILTSLRDQEGKEQHHGVINAGETAHRERGGPALPPCPEEGERDHAAGVLCYNGFGPPSAAYLLRTYAKRVILGAVTLVPTRPSPWPRERKHVYGPAVVAALVWMYHLAGDLCGKRLQAAMPELLRAMARHGTVVPDPLAAALLRMGSATMDRLLREEKARGGNRRHAPRTKPRKPPATHFRRLLPGALGCNSGTGGDRLGES